MVKIAFQGEPGANSHIACNTLYPDMEILPCTRFDDAFEALSSGAAALAMIPVENTVAGRVADIHRLLPGSGLYIIGEHFMRVNHCLLALKGADASALTHVLSHEMALGQCRKLIDEMGLQPVVAADTAGAARELADRAEAGPLPASWRQRFTGWMWCAKTLRTASATQRAFLSCRHSRTMPSRMPVM